MSNPLDNDLGQMRLSAGHRSATTAVACLVASRRRNQKQGTLYVLAAVEDDPDEAIARAIVEVVGQAYRSFRGSLTARLRRAVQAGSATLLQDNLDLVSRSPRSGGVICAVLRDNDLYLAQAGTVRACICQRGTLSRIPEGDGDSMRAFGRRGDPDVRLTYHTVEPGDSVMLADAALMRLASDENLTQALNFADAGLSLGRLAKDLSSGDGAIMVLAIRRREAPVSIPPSLPTQRASARSAPTPVSRRPPGVKVEPFDYAQDRPFDDAQDRPFDDAQDRPFDDAQDRPFDDAQDRPFDPSAELIPSEVEGLRAGDTQDRPFDHAQDRPFESLALAGPTVIERLVSVREVAGRGLATMGRAAADWLRRLMPGREGPYRGLRRPAERRLRRQAASADHPMWRPVALILPVIVVLLVVVTYWKRDWDRRARYDELLTEVERQLDIAATTDETAARQALGTALTTLDEAAEIPLQKEAISMLQADVQRQLDTLNRVYRLDDVQYLYTYPLAGKVDQLVVHGANIYVLDRLMDRVYHHRVNAIGTALESDEEYLLVRKGDRPGNAAAVGELVGMTWMPGGEGRQTGALLILGRNGLLLAYDPTWERLVGTMLPASETWQYPVDVSSYMGRFYILDPGLRQVLRYRAGGAGYNSLPEPYFPEGEAGVAEAIDMAIDGFVYLLSEDGRLEKFLGGEPVPLTLNLADQPLYHPSAIYTAPDAEVRFLYVADPSNSRVLRCDKQGRLIQQFVLEGDDALGQVQDIYVDEVGSRLYFLSDNRLLMVSIPPP